jgi:CspA family cold shock protein
MAAGRVIRFDGMRGYGFIAPEHGGEDVFLHVNDLLVPESVVRPGLLVEFEIEDGDRGLKASNVRPAHEDDDAKDRGGPAAVPRAAAAVADGPEPMCDVLSSAEYLREVTELLLSAAPELTGHQIQALRKPLVRLGSRHGWVED